MAAWRRSIPFLAAVLAAAGVARAEEFLLVDAELRSTPVRLVEIAPSTVTVLDEFGETRERRLDACVALFRPGVPPRTRDEAGGAAVLRLSDGQRLPGMPDTGATASPEEVLGWVHPWLGRLEIPLENVAQIALRPPEPAPVAGGLDVVALVDGGRLEGIIASIADPIVIDAEVAGQRRRAEIPLARASGIGLVSPPRPATGRRIWFRDGTMVDAARVGLGDDGYLRLEGMVGAGGGTVQVRLADVDAILLDAEGVIPLASLGAPRLDAVAPRYRLPEPAVTGRDGPLGVGRIVLRGPLRARYVLPDGARRFAARADLAPGTTPWGNLVLVVRDDDREVLRTTLDETRPGLEINVPLSGHELTLELLPGAHGPILDHVVFDRAMVLVGR